MRRIAVALIAMILTVSACQSSEEAAMDLQQWAETRAVESRGYVDDVVARLACTNIEIQENAQDPCDVAQENPGLILTYSVQFDVDDDALDKLQSPIADDLQADGWTVRRDGTDNGGTSLRFLRETFTLAVNVDPGVGKAVAGGSGGCLEP